MGNVMAAWKAVLVLGVAAAGWATGEADPPAGAGLPGDWSRTVELPAVSTAGGTTLVSPAVLRLWVEGGWLVTRRETQRGDLDWQVVLARATRHEPPEVEVDRKRGGLAVRYGGYFVRDTSGALRVLRERKPADAPAWPVPKLEPVGRALGWAGSGTRLSAWEAGDWCWAAAGPEGRSDVWVRVQHTELKGGGFGFNGRSPLRGFFYGDARVQDEGDLLVAERMVRDNVDRALLARKIKREMGDRPAPALAVREWVTPSPAATLADLKGKVVLVDFWGKWCGPCVKKLPRVEALHAKYKDRGLVVVGVHTDDRADGLTEFLKERRVTFPVAVDTGETARRYAVEAWPTYFLLDKAGRVAWGFSHEPPPEEEIEALLR